MSRHPLVRIARVVLCAAGLLLVTSVGLAQEPTPTAPPEDPAEGSAMPEPLWLDELDPEWFAARWNESSPVHAAAVSEGSEAERLTAIDRALRQRTATRGLPQTFVSQRWALERYRQGEIQINDYPPIRWEVPIDWHRPRPEIDETYFAELHSWRFLTRILQEYRDTGEPGLLADVEAVAEDWIRQNPFPQGAHGRAWHEGAVIKRTLVLINWLDILAARPAPEGGGERFRPHQVAGLLLQHVEYLLEPDTYTGIGNHGMRQDLVLIVASFALPDARLRIRRRWLGSDDWRGLAVRRLEGVQIAQGFTRSGIWREHSPIYHRYVAGILDLVRKALRANGAEVPERLDWLLDHRELYLAHVFTPAGRYPPVGDTAEQRLPFHIIETPELLFSVSRGREGNPPETVDGFFPDAGEVVLRERWGETRKEQENSLYLHLHAAQHLPMGHRHEDDLSFVLQGGGRWWVVDAGRHGYGKNPWRGHVVSAWAHNGVILDGRTIGARERRDLESGIDPDAVATPEVGAVRAWTERLGRSGARVDRIVVLLRNRRQVLLVDRLAAPGEGGDWESLLHLATDLAPEPGGGGAAAEGTGAGPWTYTAPSPAGDLTLDLLFHPETTESTSIYRGEAGAKAPESGRGGWVSPAPRKIVPSSTVSAHRSGAWVVTPTLLALRPPDHPPVRDLAIEELYDGTFEVSWRVGEEEVRATVAFTGAPLRTLDGEPVTGRMRPSAVPPAGR